MIPELGAEPVTLACVNRAWESEAGRQQVKGWGRGQIFYFDFIFVYMQECLPELGVVGELAWLFCTAAAAACAAFTAVLAAYRLASSWNLPIFFLYRILLLPNQLDTCVREQKEEEQKESDVKQPQHRALSSVIVSRCHVWVHQVPNSQPLQ